MVSTIVIFFTNISCQNSWLVYVIGCHFITSATEKYLTKCFAKETWESWNTTIRYVSNSIYTRKMWKRIISDYIYVSFNVKVVIDRYKNGFDFSSIAVNLCFNITAYITVFHMNKTPIAYASMYRTWYERMSLIVIWEYLSNDMFWHVVLELLRNSLFRITIAQWL